MLSGGSLHQEMCSYLPIFLQKPKNERTHSGNKNSDKEEVFGLFGHLKTSCNRPRKIVHATHTSVQNKDFKHNTDHFLESVIEGVSTCD